MNIIENVFSKIVLVTMSLFISFQSVAQYEIAEMYFSGRGVERNMQSSQSWANEMYCFE